MSIVYFSVKPSEIQNCRSLKALWKFASPTHFGGVMSDQLVNDIADHLGQRVRP